MKTLQLALLIFTLIPSTILPMASAKRQKTGMGGEEISSLSELCYTTAIKEFNASEYDALNVPLDAYKALGIPALAHVNRYLEKPQGTIMDIRSISRTIKLSKLLSSTPYYLNRLLTQLWLYRFNNEYLKQLNLAPFSEQLNQLDNNIDKIAFTQNGIPVSTFSGNIVHILENRLNLDRNGYATINDETFKEISALGKSAIHFIREKIKAYPYSYNHAVLRNLLYKAVEHGSVETIRQFISDIFFDDHLKVKHWGAISREKTFVSKLIHYATLLDKPEIVSTILKNVDIKASEINIDKLLYKATVFNSPQAAKTLINAGAKSDVPFKLSFYTSSQKPTPLELSLPTLEKAVTIIFSHATTNEHGEKNYLSPYEIDKDNKDIGIYLTAEQAALLNGNKELFELMTQGKHLKDDMLLHACLGGNVDIVRSLLSSEISPKTVDKNNNSALFYAILGRNGYVVYELLAHGADKNHHNDQGTTPLMYAAEKQEQGIVQLLLDNAVQVDLPDSEGETALFKAIRNRSKKMILTLLQAGANINLRNEEGKTPLAVAGENSSADIVNLLLEKNADINIKDKQKATVLKHVIGKLVQIKHMKIDDIFKDKLEIILLLLQKDIKVDAAEKRKMSDFCFRCLTKFFEQYAHMQFELSRTKSNITQAYPEQIDQNNVYENKIMNIIELLLESQETVYVDQIRSIKELLRFYHPLGLTVLDMFVKKGLNVHTKFDKDNMSLFDYAHAGIIDPNYRSALSHSSVSNANQTQSNNNNEQTTSNDLPPALQAVDFAHLYQPNSNLSVAPMNMPDLGAPTDMDINEFLREFGDIQ